MWALLTGLPAMLTGLFTTVSSVSHDLANEKIAFMNATTDRERAEIQERIDALQQTKSVLVADAARSSIDMWMRVIAGTGPIAIVTKIFLWDKVIGSLAGCSGKNTPASCDIFTTDPVTTEQWVLVGVVYGFLFVHSMVKS
jgi:hypothetical protein